MSAIVMAGCVDPQSDYNDWLARTADARAAGSTSDASTSFDAAPPDGGFNQVFAMACSTQLAPGFADSTRFMATATYTPGTSGGGQLTFYDQPLQAHATSMSQTVGEQTATQTVAVDSSGKAKLVFGPVVLPGAANPVTGGDADFDSTSTLNFIVGQGSLCAGLTGNITSPFPIALDPTKGDICLFVSSTADGAFPTLTDDAFTGSPCHSIPSTGF
jgi:hypothetical protein